MPLVHVGLASLAARTDYLPAVLQSLLKQTVRDWRARVVLNNYDAVPRRVPKDDRIEYVLADNTLGDAAKLDLLDDPDSQWLATIDDDLLYPPDYLEQLLGAVRQWPDVAVGVHGSILSPGYRRWQDHRYILHYTAAMGKARQVHFLGTGTTLLRKAWFEGYDRRAFRNATDIGVGLHLHRAGIARVAVARPANWIRNVARDLPAVCYTASNLRRVDELVMPHVKSLMTSEPKAPAGVQPLSQAEPAVRRDSAGRPLPSTARVTTGAELLARKARGLV